MPSSGDLPDPRIEPGSPASPVLQAGSLPLSYQGSPLNHNLQRENTRVQISALLCTSIVSLSKLLLLYELESSYL